MPIDVYSCLLLLNFMIFHIVCVIIMVIFIIIIIIIIIFIIIKMHFSLSFFGLSLSAPMTSHAFHHNYDLHHYIIHTPTSPWKCFLHTKLHAPPLAPSSQPSWSSSPSHVRRPPFSPTSLLHFTLQPCQPSHSGCFFLLVLPEFLWPPAEQQGQPFQFQEPRPGRRLRE